MLELFKRITGFGRSSVTFDEQRVVRTVALGRTESVRWDELKEVGIVTTDQGPFVDVCSGCCSVSRAAAHCPRKSRAWTSYCIDSSSCRASITRWSSAP
jgi:hypothetical protein